MNAPELRTMLSSTESPVAGENMEEILKHGDIEYPIGIYKITLRKGNHEHVRWHWHDELEYIIAVEGQVEIAVSDNTYVLKAGEALFINKGKLQQARIIKDDPDGCVYYSIIFHPTLVLAYGLTRLCSTYLNPILDNPTFIAFKITPGTSVGEEITAYIHNAIAINQKKEPFYELITKEHLLHLWVLLLQFAEVNPAALGGKELSRISLDESRSKAAIRFIEDNYSDPITLEDIADSIHVSKNECCRCIKRCMNMTPFEYLLSYRIYRSTAFLRDKESTDSVADIATKVGFNNTSYFNKVFKKLLGCTPKEYRLRDED